MASIQNALDNLNSRMADRSRRPPIPFSEFLRMAQEQPSIVLRNVFQVFHDLVTSSLGPGVEEYPDDPESIHYAHYDCNRLFEEDADHPFFADRLFANRLVKLAETMKHSAQQNKIYIFNGPPGCGKSTFLNTLLKKLEDYANTNTGMRHEILWRIDPSKIEGTQKKAAAPLVDQIAALLEERQSGPSPYAEEHFPAQNGDSVLEIPCPSHDFPLLVIPKKFRAALLSELFADVPLGQTLFSDPEYTWLFKSKPCTICSAIYRALHNKLKNPAVVHSMIYARHYRFNRRVGEGISVYNPGDLPPEHAVHCNTALQARLNSLLNDPSELHYIYSNYAKTNNGVYALMDIKSHNTERLIELHNIISEGLHKVEHVEENVNSLLVAVMNPEDQKNITNFKSFFDRIEYINIPYVMDLNTEVKIYRTIFGKQIEERFLPRVLTNFARVIISTRLATRSEALLEWIDDAHKYTLYCDTNLQLLKMDIYSGVIPPWLTEEDRKNLTARRRRRIIDESDHEGDRGISGRDSIKIFNDFYSAYSKHDKLITMSLLCDFFMQDKSGLMRLIPDGFLDSLVRQYNYNVLQEVKESLFFYNEREISRDILNYLFAVNFEPPAVEVCSYTKDKLHITQAFFERIENFLLGNRADAESRRVFREETQREYTAKALTQEIMLEKKDVVKTDIYNHLLEKYVQNVKEKALDPFLDNDNFRRAIKDYDTPDFKTYDKRIRDDVRYLLRNLKAKFGYSEQGAKEICIYVIDHDLARTFDVE